GALVRPRHWPRGARTTAGGRARLRGNRDRPVGATVVPLTASWMSRRTGNRGSVRERHFVSMSFVSYSTFAALTVGAVTVGATSRTPASISSNESRESWSLWERFSKSPGAKWSVTGVVGTGCPSTSTDATSKRGAPTIENCPKWSSVRLNGKTRWRRLAVAPGCSNTRSGAPVAFVSETEADRVTSPVQFSGRAIASRSSDQGSAGGSSGRGGRSPKVRSKGAVRAKEGSERLASPLTWNGFGPVSVPSTVTPAIRLEPWLSVMPTLKSNSNENGCGTNSASKASQPCTLNPPAAA